MNRSLSTPTRLLSVLLLTAAGALLALHYVHLRADFPNHSPWMDWSKYTDEGWYGDAAIRQFLFGHWYFPGDFNPAAALPVWPLVEAGVFVFTGVSLVAVRALTVTVFAAILAASWFLLAHRRHGARQPAGASVAVLLLAASPFCFVFTRMAILEPLLILLTLLAILAARRAKAPPQAAAGWVETAKLAIRANLRVILLLGIFFPLLILTKTTALFLMPAIFWMLFAACAYRLRSFVPIAGCSGAIAGCVWMVYYLAVVRPHFLIDYRYLFSANAYTGITGDTFVSVLTSTIKDGMWFGRTLYPLALGAVLVTLATAILRPSRLFHHPLAVVLILWSGGYMAFLAYHNNLQPRYYLVIAIPMTLLIPVVVEDLILPRLKSMRGLRISYALLGLATAAVVLPDAMRTIRYVRHPEYTLVDAAQSIAALIRADQRSDPAHNPLILSISGSDISLMTGLPSICDDFGTLELVDRVKRYKPGWYVAWNWVEDDKLSAIWPQYQMQRIAAYPAMDDPERNLLILYKLVPANTQPPPPARRHAPVPRQLRTPVGQQPSTVQLKH